MLRRMGGGQNLDWCVSDACGSVGGILICWHNRTLELMGKIVVGVQGLMPI